MRAQLTREVTANLTSPGRPRTRRRSLGEMVGCSLGRERGKEGGRWGSSDKGNDSESNKSWETEDEEEEFGGDCRLLPG